MSKTKTTNQRPCRAKKNNQSTVRNESIFMMKWLLVLVTLLYVCMQDVRGRKQSFMCMDQTIRGHTDEMIPVPCETFCMIGYSKNFFLALFEGIHYPVCQALGCAKVSPNGTFINDAKKRLGTAAMGEIIVYKCDPSSFRTHPDALQANKSNHMPCNWYNPGVMHGDAPKDRQVCTGLPIAGKDYKHVSWVLEHLWIFIGILTLVVCMLVGVGGCVFIRRRRRAGKSIDPRQAVSMHAGYSCTSFMSLGLIMFVVATTTSFAVGMQPYVLRDVLDRDGTSQSSLTFAVLLTSALWAMFCAIGFGFMCDRIGRRIVVVLGMAQNSLALFLLPHSGDGYVVIMMLFFQGIVALWTSFSTLLADMVNRNSIGIAMTFFSFAAGCGTMVGLLMLVQDAPKNHCLKSIYHGVAVMPLITIVLLWYGLGPICDQVTSLDESFEAQQGSEDSDEDQASTEILDDMVTEASDLYMHGAVFRLNRYLSMAKNNPRLVCSFISTMTGQAIYVALSFFLTRWIIEYYENHSGKCGHSTELEYSPCHEDLIHPDKRRCPAGFNMAMRFTGTVETVLFLLVLVAGPVANNVQAGVHRLMIISIFGAVAFAWALLVKDPSAELMYLLAVGWASTQVFLNIFSQVILVQELNAYQKHHRGMLAGIFTFYTFLGSVFCYGTGTVLVNNEVDGRVVFVLMGFLSIFGSYVCFKCKNKLEAGDPSLYQPLLN